MSQKNSLILAREWLKRGDDDELSCMAIIKENGAPSTLCFLSHQIAEKYLKGLAVFYGKEVGKIHDLIKLANVVIDSVSEIKKHQKELSLLNRYYIETRYPGDWPNDFSWREAKLAFESAKSIKEFVLNKIINN